MSEEYGDNIWADLDDLGDGVSGARLRRGNGTRLAAAVWELAPHTDGVVFHFHHGTEELLFVLRGRPILRTADGERQLEEGEVVHFAPGPEGAHKLSNPTDEPVRYVMAAAQAVIAPDIVEYPDEGTYAAFAKTDSQHGEPFFVRDELKRRDV